MPDQQFEDVIVELDDTELDAIVGGVDRKSPN
jgi:hypothetical protein